MLQVKKALTYKPANPGPNSSVIQPSNIFNLPVYYKVLMSIKPDQLNKVLRTHPSMW